MFGNPPLSYITVVEERTAVDASKRDGGALEHAIWRTEGLLTDATYMARFSYALPPVLSYIYPTSGPRAGGTAVTLHGVNLANGTHYKC